MTLRWLPALALLGLLSLVADPAPSARAQQGGAAPALVLRVRPLDNLKADIRYLIAQTGQEELAKQLEAMVKPLLARTGIDTTRPLGGYGSVGSFGILDSSGVVLVPMADENAFVAWLDSTGFTTKKGTGNVYTLTKLLRDSDAYLRFANKYAYISNDRAALADQKLVAPSVMFPADAQAAASLSLRLGQVPKSIRDLFLDQLKAKLALAREKGADQTDAQARFTAAAFDHTLAHFRGLLEAGNELALRLDIDSKAGAVTGEVVISGQPKSKLAATIAEVGAAKSAFSGVVGTSDSALSFLVHNAMTPQLKAAFAPVVDEAIQKALGDDKLRPENRILAEKLLTALAPTLRSGDLDLAVSLRGPTGEGKYTMLAASRVTDGAGLEKSLRELVKLLRPQEQARIQLDAAKQGTIAIHKLDIRQDVAAKAKEVFGDGPLYVAVRPDAFYFAFGASSLSVLQEALATKPAPGPLLQLDVALSRFAPFFALEEGNKDIAKAAETAFKNRGNDRIKISIEGGKALRTRFSMNGEVIRFLAEVAKARGVPIPAADNQ